MPNPDVTGNWAPQIRRAGTLLWCCKQLGHAEPLPLAVCCRVQKEREKTREKESREIWTDPFWCSQNNLGLPLLSNWHNTNQLPSSSGAELSLWAWIESGGAFIAGGANNPMITWPVQKELQQAGGYPVNGGARVGMFVTGCSSLFCL